MMKKLITIVLLGFSLNAFAADGLVKVGSNHDVKTTTDKLEQALKAKGMKVFLRVDHAAGAAGIGKELRPTELVVFGNPKLGSALMGCAQTSGIDLPMKALVYQDESGKVYLAYNDPAHLKSRHAMQGCDKPLGKATGALANFAKAATQ
jgi:uncharacterized protein (DUF302 family)